MLGMALTVVLERLLLITGCCVGKGITEFRVGEAVIGCCVGNSWALVCWDGR